MLTSLNHIWKPMKNKRRGKHFSYLLTLLLSDTGPGEMHMGLGIQSSIKWHESIVSEHT